MRQFEIRRAAPADVPAINQLLIKLRENCLSDPAVITEAMTTGAISETGRGRQDCGLRVNGEVQFRLYAPGRKLPQSA